MNSRTLIDQDTIPQELWTYQQSVCWHYGEPKPGRKPPKIPINCRTLGRAGVNWRNTWCDFRRTIATYKANEWLAGVGFVLTRDDPFVGVDIDACIKNGEPSPFACELLDELGTYAEISPSGNGIRMIVRCERLPIVITQPGIEIYPADHWISLTGNALNAHPIAEFSDLDWLTERFKPAPLVEQSHICAPVLFSVPQYPAVTASDATLWQRIRRGPLSDALYRGNISQARNDNSNAVVILLKQLALHTLGNPERMERMLKQTKLDQSRWDEKRGQYTWLQVRIFDVIQRNAAAIEARHQAREVVR